MSKIPERWQVDYERAGAIDSDRFDWTAHFEQAVEEVGTLEARVRELEAQLQAVTQERVEAHCALHRALNALPAELNTQIAQLEARNRELREALVQLVGSTISSDIKPWREAMDQARIALGRTEQETKP